MTVNCSCLYTFHSNMCSISNSYFGNDKFVELFEELLIMSHVICTIFCEVTIYKPFLKLLVV